MDRLVGLGRILASVLEQDAHAARVLRRSAIAAPPLDEPQARTLRAVRADRRTRIGRTRQIVDHALDDDPERVLGRVLGDVRARPLLVLAGLDGHRAGLRSVEESERGAGRCGRSGRAKRWSVRW